MSSSSYPIRHILILSFPPQICLAISFLLAYSDYNLVGICRLLPYVSKCLLIQPEKPARRKEILPILNENGGYSFLSESFNVTHYCLVLKKTATESLKTCF